MNPRWKVPDPFFNRGGQGCRIISDIHLLPTDAHGIKKHPPLLSRVVEELSKLIGKGQARAMVTIIPEKIVRGESLD